MNDGVKQESGYSSALPAVPHDEAGWETFLTLRNELSPKHLDDYCLSTEAGGSLSPQVPSNGWHTLICTPVREVHGGGGEGQRGQNNLPRENQNNKMPNPDR